MFDTGCTLPHLPADLEVRKDHHLVQQTAGKILGMIRDKTVNINLKSILEFSDGIILYSRCAHSNQALIGNILFFYKQKSFTFQGSSHMRCKDGGWDNSLPFCYNTSTREKFDGKHAYFIVCKQIVNPQLFHDILLTPSIESIVLKILEYWGWCCARRILMIILD